MIKIKKIPYLEAEKIAKICKVKGMNFDKDNTYYGLYNQNNDLISIASYKIVKNVVHFKSNFTIPSERRKGYMSFLLKYIIDSNNFKEMKTYCLESSYKIYLKLGFKLEKIVKHKYFDTYIVRKSE